MLRELYIKLCMTTVFRGVLDKPLFKFFAEFCREDATDAQRTLAYAGLAREVLSSGKSLSELCAAILFEDENIYVKARAKGQKIAPEIKDALKHELSVLEKFASLTPEDFRAELGAEYVTPFRSAPISLSRLYESHVRKISTRGYGIFSGRPMFRLSDDLIIEPIVSADRTELSHFVGYESQREQVIGNVLALTEGRPALNTLLYGNAGTGKSSTVKAVANHFFDKGVRLIELRRDQLCYLPLIMAKISENPLKFIIFIDDLSFNKSDDNFSMLKAALEGSASATADNAIIMATSNRRHIVKESFSDRDGDDVHRNDTLQESLSLSERFGLVISYSKPTKQLYLDIVRELAHRHGITLPENELDIRAEAFALKRGTRSARAAEQFIDLLLSEKKS